MIVLITPPLTQLNTPYPAVPMLTRYLRELGEAVHQYDFSLDLSLRLFTEKVVRLAAQKASQLKDEEMAFFASSEEEYATTVESVIAFLQGRSPELAWRISNRNYLPEGPHFVSLDDGEDESGESVALAAFGSMGIADRAKYLCSLYLDDLAGYFTKAMDSDFGFGKYAASLSVSLTSLEPMLHRLEKTSPIDELLDQLTEEMVRRDQPSAVCLSVPFPGTLYGAFRIAKKVREQLPSCKICLGGGYVNSELREFQDMRLFNYFDGVSFDRGFQPLHTFLKGTAVPISGAQPIIAGGAARIRTRQGYFALPEGLSAERDYFPVPDYSDYNLNRYFSLVEMSNPMHRIWTDGAWLKLELAQGCYWHRCAFCDVALDYIGCYHAADPVQIVDAMEKLHQETGRCGFHFVDEALPPALLERVSQEILRRHLAVSWWGNIRFEKGFTPELTQTMAEAGCIAVTGGLECAQDRLLSLMNKGISLKSARQVLENFADTGILVHSYLMYGFPTETKREALEALEFVRGCFADGVLHSAFWHRFALTAHSVIARNPEKFHIRLLDETPNNAPLFARNELHYQEPGAPDWDKIGRGLDLAVYNYMLGMGLDRSPEFFLK